MRILALFAEDVLRARSVANQRPPKGSLRPALADGATTTTTTTTACLFPVVAQGEGPTIPPPEVAQVPGRLSPRGTFEIQRCLSSQPRCRGLTGTFLLSPCASL